MVTSPLKDFNSHPAGIGCIGKLPVTIGGKKIKPGQCYHFSTHPPGILFNTNCPEELKGNVNGIPENYSAKKLEQMDDITGIAFEQEGIKFKGWFTKTATVYAEVLSDVFSGIFL